MEAAPYVNETNTDRDCVHVTTTDNITHFYAFLPFKENPGRLTIRYLVYFWQQFRHG